MSKLRKAARGCEGVGGRHHMLVAVERLAGSKYLCRCDCGGERVVNVGHFNTGKIKSCGCHVVRHGHSGSKGEAKSREYVSYHNMISRCHKSTNKRYADYGGKGIEVCERWRDSFVNFIEDMGECPDGYQIDRIDNSKGYSPDNCRWVSPKQNVASRDNTAVWTVKGACFLSAKEAGKHIGVSAATIRARCLGRIAEGRYYPPLPGYSRELLSEAAE